MTPNILAARLLELRRRLNLELDSLIREVSTNAETRPGPENPPDFTLPDMPIQVDPAVPNPLDWYTTSYGSPGIGPAPRMERPPSLEP